MVVEIIKPKASVTSCMPWKLVVRVDKKTKITVRSGSGYYITSVEGGPGLVEIPMKPVPPVAKGMVVMVETAEGEVDSKTLMVTPYELWAMVGFAGSIFAKSFMTQALGNVAKNFNIDIASLMDMLTLTSFMSIINTSFMCMGSIGTKNK